MPLVSIGMPVYNDKLYIDKALNSLLQQTFRDFELIISDDCSTDGSKDICISHAAKDKRIRYFRQATNMGISRNMEFLLSEASGKYFMWAANDDMWASDFIETLLKGFNDDSIVSVFCPMYFINEQDDMINRYGIRNPDYSAPTAYRRLQKLVRIFDDGFGYGLFRTDKIREVRFPIWWWANKNCAYNNIYPTLCYYLAKGDFRSVGENPLWFNRLKEEKNVHHQIPYNNTFGRGYLCFVLRKFNMVTVSLINIYKAQKKTSTALAISPYMLYRWWLIPTYIELKVRFKDFLRGKLKFW